MNRVQSRHSSRVMDGLKRVLAITMIAQQLSHPLIAHAATFGQTGRWTTATPRGSIGFSGTHVALLREPQSNAAKVFLFGESGSPQTMKFWKFFATSTGASPPDSASLIPIGHPNDYSTDLFCSGHSTLADGRLLMMGEGWIAPEPCRDIYVLDPAWLPGASSEAWTEYAPMAVERWYGTATTLADGRVLATGGTMSSRAIGFGGVKTDGSTYRIVHPLDFSSVTNWGDTLVVPANNPPSNSRVKNDTWTAGQFPPPREFHAFTGNYAGQGVLYGGRSVYSDTTIVRDDVWLLNGSVIDDDSTHIWLRNEQYGDPSAGADSLPGARSHHAMVWAGLENRASSRMAGANDHAVCFIYGGLRPNGQPLGDLWRGEWKSAQDVHPFPNNHGAWFWTRLWPDDPSTRRYGHTMVFDPGPSPNGTPTNAPYARLVIQGGRTSSSTFADPAKLTTYGLGASAGHQWKTVTPSGTQGSPPAREGHAMTWKSKPDSPGTPREYLQYGGTDAAGAIVPGDMWVLSRPDALLADTLAYSWKKLPISSPASAPPGRTRAGLAYIVDGQLTTVVGGDKDGGNTSTGLTNEVWNLVLDPDSLGTGKYLWVSPTQRAFHPAPPPIAGMTFIAAGEGNGRITRSLELFTTAANSPPLSGDPCPQPGTLPGQWSVVTTNDGESMRRVADYAQMHLLPDGRVFNAGPAPWGDLTDIEGRDRYRRFFDIGLKRWVDGNSAGQRDAIHFGSSVMYRPGKILRAGQYLEDDKSGDKRTETINISINAPNPTWTQYDDTSNPPLLPRMGHNLTVLPTGDVLASGGVSSLASGIVAERRPQIWKVSEGTWSNPNSADPLNTELLAQDPLIRNYHSTAILLPDGRVLTAGGEKPSPDETTASVFEPPYLFQGNALADRPDILDLPEKPGYGTTFTLTLESADSNRVSNVKSIALIRPSAVTHGFDQNQRYVPLGFIATGSPKRIIVQAPSDSFIAPPGDYMLFVVDSLANNARRVPSLARWVVMGRSTGVFRDSLDSIAPRGGSYLGLSNGSQCPSYNGDITLNWNAPADDDTISFSGLARSYNLRYKLNASGENNFNAWTAVGTPVPGPCLTNEQATISGLTSGAWYRFQLKAVGDNADTSGLSNALVAKATLCEDDGGAGSGGGGGTSARAAGQFAVSGGTSGPQENSLFSGPLVSGPHTDALRLSATPRLSLGQRLAYIWQGGARGLALDRVRLVTVDRSPTERSAMNTSGSLIAGAWSAARTVLVSDTDVTAEATGVASEPLYADSGAVLTVTLPAAATEAGSHLWIECSAGGDGGGVAVLGGVEESASDTLARIHPRRRWSEHAVPLNGVSALRLRFDGAYAIRALGLLSGTHAADTSSAVLTNAVVTGGSDRLEAAMALDGRECIVPSGDTLQLAFSDPAGTEQARDWYLVVEGQPLTAEAAAARARPAREEVSARLLAFRVQHNTPNPFRRSTVISFDLPMSGVTRLEIFDAQGRLIRALDTWSPAGRSSLVWDQRDRDGRLVGAGIYHYRLRWAGREARDKMVVLP